MHHIEKIKKLLRLARDKSASPAEAAQALARAPLNDGNKPLLPG